MPITYTKKTTGITNWEYIEMLDSENPESVTVIPIDPANSDYQAYLKSLDEANTL
jgi:hypothetical protein